MAFSGIQAVIDFYTVQSAQLTNDISDILTKINRATRTASEYAQDVSSQREEVQAKYDSESTKYKTEMSEIDDNYKVKLAEITDWESQLETQKQEKEVTLETCNSYKQSYLQMLKQNVSSDFKYAQNGSSS